MLKTGIADTDRKYMLLAFRIIGDFGVAIAVPVVVLAWLGRQADVRYGTKPWGLIIGFVLAAIFSSLVVNRRAKVYAREYEALGRTGKKQS